MNVRSNQQRILWEFVESYEAQLVDYRNRLGPYYLPEGEEVHRHLACPNYESCLDFAANNKWPSFSCLNCRKTVGGTFE